MRGMGNTSERGQALVLIVLAVVALLGFTALAVDGSMVYSDRRHAQNASDASALAGGAAAAMEIEKASPSLNYSSWPCTSANITSGTVPSSLNTVSSKAKLAAANSANENGIVFATNETKTTVLDNKHGVYLSCGAEGSGYFLDKFLEVHSLITHQTNTSFAHFVFGGQLVNSIEAVARVRPRQNLAFGYAIVALNPDACSGLQNGAMFRGSTLIEVDGGGIWSNGCMSQDGSGPNFHVQINDAGAYYCTKDNNDSFDAFIDEDGDPNIPQVTGDYTQGTCAVIPPTSYLIDEPDCTHPDAHNVSGNQFESAAKAAGGLDPGLWCVSGDVHINAHDEINGNGVTIVLKNGGMVVNGNAIVNLSAPNTANPEPAVNGLLIYAPPSNTNEIQINGNEGSHWVGTILATGATIDIAGNADTEAIKTQIIAWDVKVGGDSDTFIQYIENQQMQIPTRMDLWR